MNTNNNNPDPKNKEIANVDSGKKSEDTLDENTGADTGLSEDVNGLGDDIPDSHKGLSGTDQPSSNKGQGPSGENL